MEKLSFLPPSTFRLHFVSAFVTTFFFLRIRTDLLSHYMLYIYFISEIKHSP